MKGRFVPSTTCGVKRRAIVVSIIVLDATASVVVYIHVAILLELSAIMRREKRVDFNVEELKVV
jgi:hypothetical protein